jgi:hypothetical protein
MKNESMKGLCITTVLAVAKTMGHTINSEDVSSPNARQKFC